MPGVPVVDADRHLVGFVSHGHLLASSLPKYLATMEDLSFIKESGDAWVHYIAESADRPVSEVMSTEVSSVELGKSEVAVAHKMVHDGASSVMVAHLSRQLYHALHELEALQARRLGGNAPLARLDVQGIPESYNCKTNPLGRSSLGG
jgi:CBS-domain-containing membrane protein